MGYVVWLIAQQCSICWKSLVCSNWCFGAREHSSKGDRDTFGRMSPGKMSLHIPQLSISLQSFVEVGAGLQDDLRWCPYETVDKKTDQRNVLVHFCYWQRALRWKSYRFVLMFFTCTRTNLRISVTSVERCCLAWWNRVLNVKVRCTLQQGYLPILQCLWIFKFSK